ncbi:fkbM [Scenedesmus sp. PABB004]|nr:fkbM [Scenedesmus sp. PABB004]
MDGAAPAPALLEFCLRGTTLELHTTGPAAAAEDAFILQEVLLDRCYFRHGVSLRPGDAVVDVGAHVGAFAAAALASVPGGDVTYLGVEPAPPTFAALTANLLGCGGAASSGGSFFELNPAYGHVAAPPAPGRVSPPYPRNVTLERAALAREAPPGGEAATLVFFPAMPANSTLAGWAAEKAALQGAAMPERFASRALLTAPLRTLGELLAAHGLAGGGGGGVALLKVDCEGAELEVLQGLGGPDAWRSVRQVVAEVHDVLPGEFDAPPGAPPGRAPPAAAPPELRGPRGGGIDGAAVVFVPHPGAPGAPPPREGGRVLAVAALLAGAGMAVVIECPLLIQGLPINYAVFARRPDG